MISLIVGQFLIWALGVAWAAVAWRTRGGPPLAAIRPRPSHAIVFGYGYPIGSIFLTLWMRGLSAAGVSWTWLSIAGPMVAMTVLALAILSGAERSSLLRMGYIRGPDDAVAGTTSKTRVIMWWGFLALIATHLTLAFLEVVWRPTFPWDSWTQWATKARVWYEQARQVPFVDAATWLGGAGFTDGAPHYPANVPLLQVWACITLRQWDDSMMNIPSIFLALGLAISFYGQMRYAGRGALLSIAAAYAVISMPIVDTHIALAGYADFPLAVYFGLAAIALWQWAVTRDRAQLLMAIALAIACPLTKNPGWAWLATLLPVVIIALVPNRGLLIVAIVSVLGIGVAVAFGQGEMSVMGYRVGMTYRPVWEPLWQNYFQFANWHLLWYLLPILMVVNARRVWRPPLVAGSLIVVGGLTFLFIVFSFTNAAAWVSDYSTVNRATLHLAPVLVFYLFSLLNETVAGATISFPGREASSTAPS